MSLTLRKISANENDCGTKIYEIRKRMEFNLNPDTEYSHAGYGTPYSSCISPVDDIQTYITDEELLAFQDHFDFKRWHTEDGRYVHNGSFSIANTWRGMQSDDCIDFCFFPTYIGASILMKRHLANLQENKTDERILDTLTQALDCVARIGLMGHGFDYEDNVIQEFDYFLDGGLAEFMVKCPEVSPKFHKLISGQIDKYKKLIAEGKTTGAYDSDYKEDWQRIIEKLS